MGLRAVPSSATLRQRFDAFGCEWSELADQINRAILGLRINGAPIDFGALESGHLPLDIDTFVMDQSDTHNQGMSHTYHLVCSLAALAMNLLRIVGQHTLHESDTPLRKAALRRRIKTVMQQMMYKASRIIRHARGGLAGCCGYRAATVALLCLSAPLAA